MNFYFIVIDGCNMIKMNFIHFFILTEKIKYIKINDSREDCAK
jgi:hypothetical protein